MNYTPMTNPRSYKYNIMKYSALCVTSVISGNNAMQPWENYDGYAGNNNFIIFDYEELFS